MNREGNEPTAKLPRRPDARTNRERGRPPHSSVQRFDLQIRYKHAAGRVCNREWDARVLDSHGVNVYTAKINTLGERAEDSFLVTGEALHDSKQVVRLEAELVRELQPA